ncbi:MAG: TonB-dependent receptor [Spongiibacteraceae bacterium]|nr:TonB-dependent receptor [Spongiibacteraceae bacterium]
MMSRKLINASRMLAIATLAGIGPVHAQGSSDPYVLEEVLITGSLIRGAVEDSALPIDVVTFDELRKMGSPSIVELFKQLPISSGVIGDTNQFDSKSQATEGMASVNLRGLSPQRTLVLLNSKRLVDAGVAVPFVDVNMLPMSALGRVEILKDGASATYGSDAVAGVVNFITRSDQEGFQISGDYKFIEDSDGDYTLGGSYGLQEDSFRVFVAADISHRSLLKVSDRDYALKPYEANPEGGWTGGGNPATFLTIGATGVTSFSADPDCAPLGGYVKADARCATQYTGYDALVEEEDRVRAYGEIAIDLADNLELEFSGLYGYTETPKYLSSPSFILTQAPTGGGGFTLDPTGATPMNPGLAQLLIDYPDRIPAGTGLILIPPLLYRPFMSGGNPLFDTTGGQENKRDAESMRFTAELTGSLTESLDFQTSVTYHKYKRYYESRDSFGDKVQLALNGFGGVNCDPTTGTAGVGDCKWLNPFGNAVTGTGPSNDDPDLIRGFFVKSITEIETELFVAEFTVSGETGFVLSGGDVMFGAGAQYRENGFNSYYGPNNNLATTPCLDTPVNGNTDCDPSVGALAFLGTNLNADLESDVYAVFMELQLPVTDDVDVQVAARYEDYGSQTGSTFDPKITARWQINDIFAVRGSASTTFRGPPPQQVTSAGPTTLQLIGSAFRPVEVIGNPDLQPESSTNYSAGLIFNAGDFSGSVDFFAYEIEDSITSEPLSGMVNTLFADAGNCTDAAYTALRNRFQFSDGGGVAGAGTCSISTISRVTTNWVNGGERNFSGLDFIVNYSTDGVFGGQLGAGVTATYMLEAEVGEETVEGLVVQQTFDSVGLLNFQTSVYPVPEWKGQMYLEWSQEVFNARLTVNYSEGYHDQRADNNPTSGPFAPRVDIVGTPTLTQGTDIDSQTTADLNLLFNVSDSATINLAVLNLTDEDPSFARLDYNYDPYSGSPVGRQIKLGFSAEF